MDHFTGPRGEPDAFGNGANTQAHRINLVMSTTPQTLRQISSRCGLSNIDRIRQHMRFLIEHGFAQQDGDRWVLTEDAAVNFFGKICPEASLKYQNGSDVGGPNPPGSDTQRKLPSDPTPDTSRDRTGGAGFGDPETNRKVEKLAIIFVTKWYQSRGWTVDSVEAEKCGFDLRCARNADEEHVEVKGVQGEGQSFPITASEVRQASRDSRFILCVVTSALSNQPSMHRFTGKEFLNSFDLEPLAFMARLRCKTP